MGCGKYGRNHTRPFILYDFTMFLYSFQCPSGKKRLQFRDRYCRDGSNEESKHVFVENLKKIVFVLLSVPPLIRRSGLSLLDWFSVMFLSDGTGMVGRIMFAWIQG